MFMGNCEGFYAVITSDAEDDAHNNAANVGGHKSGWYKLTKW